MTDIDDIKYKYDSNKEIIYFFIIGIIFLCFIFLILNYYFNRKKNKLIIPDNEKLITVNKKEKKSIYTQLNVIERYPLLYFLYGFLFTIFIISLLQVIIHHSDENNVIQENYNYFFCSKVL